MYCPNCGTNNEKGARFCISCGYDFKSVNAHGDTAHRTEPEASPASPEPSPSAESHSAGSTKPKKGRNPYTIGIVIAIVLIVVGFFVASIPGDSPAEEKDYALVTFTVYNDQNQTLNITLEGGGVTYFEPVDLKEDYFKYGLNFYIVELDGESDVITFTATGVGLSTGTTYTDSETLTLHSGEQYRVVLHL